MDPLGSTTAESRLPTEKDSGEEIFLFDFQVPHDEEFSPDTNGV